MDLRAFIIQLEALNELKVVEGADWNLEIGAITELSDERNGPALLFDHIKGYPPGYRVATNLTATPRRLATALGLSPDIPNIELARLVKDRLRGLKPIPPTYVEKGCIMEEVYDEGEIDLLKFPVPLWHEHDGGRYIGTADMVIMRDPKDGWVNVGTYRIQVHDHDTTGLYIAPGKHGRLIRERYWAEGKSCPVAMVFGMHPLIWMPAYLGIPWGTEEYAIAGGLIGEPLQVITGDYTGLPIPAWAEIAIEGDCPPPQVESREEGPFGEAPGYYGSGERLEPVVRVKRVMHRHDPVITGNPPMKPPSSGCALYIMRASNIWHELEGLGIPGIKGVWNMRAGSARFITVVSIEQKYAGHAKQVAMAAMSGIDGAYLGRFVIVVDDDIDPSNHDDVLWAMATRCDPATSLEIVKGCWSGLLDPTIDPERRARGDLTNSRAVVLACRPYHWRKDFPKVNRASDALRSQTMKKWGHLLHLSF
ncbi:MAG: UbiD family decarboxylase [Chloroflexi bacterium]|nr:UbiD family decarboxylase [Chloroflexota bacterium]